MLTKINKLNNKLTFQLKQNISSDNEKYETFKVNCADDDENINLDNIINEQRNSLIILKNITIQKLVEEEEEPDKIWYIDLI